MCGSRRRRAQAGIAALIDYLDAITPDADLEPSFGFLPFGGIDEVEPDADYEPGLGAPEVEFRSRGLPIARGHFDQRHWADGYGSGFPDDADNEVDDADAEPSLGAPERHPSRYYGRDLHADQTWWASGGGQDHEEVNEDGGDILDEPHDDFQEGDDSDREPALGLLDGRFDQRAWSRGLGSEEGDFDEVTAPHAGALERRERFRAFRMEADAILDRHSRRRPCNVDALVPIEPGVMMWGGCVA